MVPPLWFVPPLVLCPHRSHTPQRSSIPVTVHLLPVRHCVNNFFGTASGGEYCPSSSRCVTHLNQSLTEPFVKAQFRDQKNIVARKRWLALIDVSLVRAQKAASYSLLCGILHTSTRPVSIKHCRFITARVLKITQKSGRSLTYSQRSSCLESAIHVTIRSQVAGQPKSITSHPITTTRLSIDPLAFLDGPTRIKCLECSVSWPSTSQRLAGVLKSSIMPNCPACSDESPMFYRNYLVSIFTYRHTIHPGAVYRPFGHCRESLNEYN
jgi:hypothetical protein